MTELTDLSETDASNVTITGIDINEGCAPSGMNNAARNTLGLIRRMFKSTIFRIRDATDQTKLLAFNLSGVATATTRTLTMGDADVTLRPQAWEHISTTSISSATDWQAIDLSAYRTLRISGYMLPATDAVALSLRTSTNNGSSYDGGASDYSWYRVYGVADVPASDGDAADNRIDVGGTASVGNVAGEGTHFEMLFYNFNQSLVGRTLTHASSITSTGGYSVNTTGALRVSTTARNAVAMYFSSGNIASGYVVVEGMRG